MSHLEDGSWSAPSAISCLGVGYGAQAGLEFTDLVIVLRDENALNALSQVGNLTIGGSVSATLGPWGRSAEISMAATCALCYAFSKTRGLFGGISVEGLGFCEGRKANTKCYGQGVTARHILNGQIQPNMEIQILLDALNLRFPHPNPKPNSKMSVSSIQQPPPPFSADDKAPLIQNN